MDTAIDQITSLEDVDWKALSHMKIDCDNDYIYHKCICFINKHQDKSWDWNVLISKIYIWDLEQIIKFETVLTNPDVNWPWFNFTREFLCKVPYEKIAENHHLKWDWRIISERFSNVCSLSKIHLFRDCPLDWNVISENINKDIKHKIIPLDDLPEGYFVTDHFDDFLNYLDFPWDWDIIYSGLPKVKVDKLDEKRAEQNV